MLILLICKKLPHLHFFYKKYKFYQFYQAFYVKSILSNHLQMYFWKDWYSFIFQLCKFVLNYFTDCLYYYFS